MRSMWTGIITTKLIRMHVRGIGVKMWFGVLIVKSNNTTPISMHEYLTFVKHIYVDVNADVITVRVRFMQQDWAGLVGASKVGTISYSSRIYSLFLIYCSFSLRHVSCRMDTIRLVIRCSVIDAIYWSDNSNSYNLLSPRIMSFGLL
jgi:hypothetical protein